MLKVSLMLLCFGTALLCFYMEYLMAGMVMLALSAVCQYGWGSFWDFGAKAQAARRQNPDK